MKKKIFVGIAMWEINGWQKEIKSDKRSYNIYYMKLMCWTPYYEHCFLSIYPLKIYDPRNTQYSYTLLLVGVSFSSFSNWCAKQVTNLWVHPLCLHHKRLNNKHAANFGVTPYFSFRSLFLSTAWYFSQTNIIIID